VKPSKKPSTFQLAEIIERRAGVGQQDIVEGWHGFLKRILLHLAPHLRAGHLVTFQTLQRHERQFYQKLHHKIPIPQKTGAIYIPPSVRYQMMYTRPEGQSQPIPEHDPENPPDVGVILASSLENYDIIVNALLAKPPFTPAIDVSPAIDVYDNGRLSAGYIYHTIDECIADMNKVLKTHFHTPAV
jgi:hypothetical protein